MVITLNSVTGDITKLPFASAFSLCPYENKLSVLNFTIQRHGSDEDTIKSKDELIIMVRISNGSCISHAIRMDFALLHHVLYLVSLI